MLPAVQVFGVMLDMHTRGHCGTALLTLQQRTCIDQLCTFALLNSLRCTAVCRSVVVRYLDKHIYIDSPADVATARFYRQALRICT
jgi:hypothetical protein